MTRTLKNLALFLMVSTVSFAFAQQDEAGKAKKGEAGEFIETNVKKAGGVKLDSPAKTGGSSKPMPAEISGEVMQDNAEVSGKDPKKGGSFWSRLFGKKEKEKKQPE